MRYAAALLCLLLSCPAFATFRPLELAENYSVVASGGTGETLYAAGFYEAPSADANLTQASASVNLGIANNPYGAHVFIVAGGAGTASGGTGSVVIQVSGTSITDAGVRTTTDTETVVADITALSANAYAESVKKFIGQVTVSLVCDGGCTHTTYAADINYGFAKYADALNSDITMTGFECTGLAGANDADFEIEIIHHKTTNWTYHATAFVPGPTAIYKLSTSYVTELDLDGAEFFAWKRVGLNVPIDGSNEEGYLIRVTTGVGNAVAYGNCTIVYDKNQFSP